MDERIWTVYIHTNKTNNKVYVGKTSQNPDDRWMNGYGYRNSPCFYNAIQKYGWDNFEHIIFADQLTAEEAAHMEILLIALYKTNRCKYSNPTYGYNLTDGGEGSTGYIFSEESRMKMSQAAIERLKDPNERERIRQSLLGRFDGENNPFYGKTHSEESRLKMSNALKGRVSPNKGKPLSEDRKQQMSEYMKERLADPRNHPMYGVHKYGEEAFRYGTGRHIIQLTMDGEFVAEYISACEAEKQTGIPNSNIYGCCNHKPHYKSAGGFRWKYKDEENVQ